MAEACLGQAVSAARPEGDLGVVTRTHGPRGHRGVLSGWGGQDTERGPQGDLKKISLGYIYVCRSLAR